MMALVSIAYFVVCSVVALFGGLSVVLSRSPIRAAVGLLLAVLGIAGLYLRLHAELLAAVQIIVYAGAVVVLFVFVVMLLGPDASSAEVRGRAWIERAIAGGLALVLAVLAFVLLAPRGGVPTRLGPVAPDHGTVEAVGTQLFREALVPFELATVLLVVAAVGAMAIARGPGRRKPPTAPLAASPTLRFFTGPVLPRDAVGIPAASRPPVAPAPEEGSSS